MAGTEGGAVKGLFSLNDELSNFRTYMIDQAPLIRKWVGRIPLTTLLMMKQNKRFKSTYKSISTEVAEETNYLTIYGTGVSGVDAFTTSYFDVLDADKKFLHLGQILTNQSIKYDGNTYTKPTVPVANTQFEKAEIVFIGSDGSGTTGSGKTKIGIKRAAAIFGGTGTGFGTVLWASGDIVSRGNFAAYDSQGVGKSTLMQPSLVYTYCQDFRKPFGVTERDMEEALWVKKDPKQYAMEQSLWNFMYELDRALMFESAGLETSVNGLNQTFTHSLASVIPSANILSISAPTPAALNATLKPFAERGQESDYRVLICSSNFMMTMTDMYQSYLKDEPLNGQKNVGFTIPTYTHPLGVKFQLFYSRSVSESVYGQGTAAAAFVANMEYINLAVFKGRTRSFDLHVDLGKDGKGLQANDAKKWIGQHRFVGGLDVNNYTHHGLIYF